MLFGRGTFNLASEMIDRHALAMRRWLCMARAFTTTGSLMGDWPRVGGLVEMRARLLLSAVAIVAAASITPSIAGASPVADDGRYRFEGGFATLARLISDQVGEPIEDEQYGPGGDSTQATTRGVMMWRRADNWTAFANGTLLWVNGPGGIEVHPFHGPMPGRATPARSSATPAPASTPPPAPAPGATGDSTARSDTSSGRSPSRSLRPGPATDTAFHKDVKVLAITYSPRLSDGRTLAQKSGWRSASQLLEETATAINGASGGAATFRIVESREEAGFAPARGGIQMSPDQFDQACNRYFADPSCQQFGRIDYEAIFQSYRLCEKVGTGQIDEVWLMGVPWNPNGWEFSINGPSIRHLAENMPNCGRTLVVMHFNNSRGVAESLHSFAHRVETMVGGAFAGPDGPSSPWARFLGRDQCGTVHNPPNSSGEYDYTNRAQATSGCDSWYNYPIPGAAPRTLTCEAWGCTQDSYMEWWLSHLASGPGATGHRWNDWWRYIADWDASR